MKKRIVISESEKKEILSKHLSFGYKTINEQTVQDIQNKLNKDFGANITADNKFGPKTATAIINALDKIKSGTITPASTANTTNTASTTTQVTNAQGTTTPSSTANTTNTQVTNNQVTNAQGTTTPASTANTAQVTNNQGATTADNTVKATPDKTKKEDPTDGD
jgi:hypothetical protein